VWISFQWVKIVTIWWCFVHLSIAFYV